MNDLQIIPNVPQTSQKQQIRQVFIFLLNVIIKL